MGRKWFLPYPIETQVVSRVESCCAGRIQFRNRRISTFQVRPCTVASPWKGLGMQERRSWRSENMMTFSGWRWSQRADTRLTGNTEIRDQAPTLAVWCDVAESARAPIPQVVSGGSLHELRGHRAGNNNACCGLRRRSSRSAVKRRPPGRST